MGSTPSVATADASISTFLAVVLSFVATELLFLRFPFKPLHLLPAAMAVALVVGHFGTEARRWIGRAMSVAFSPDGKRLAFGRDGGATVVKIQ